MGAGVPLGDGDWPGVEEGCEPGVGVGEGWPTGAPPPPSGAGCGGWDGSGCGVGPELESGVPCGLG